MTWTYQQANRLIFLVIKIQENYTVRIITWIWLACLRAN